MPALVNPASLESMPVSTEKRQEIFLEAFIRFSHAQIQARRYSYEQTLQLLDRAGEAQKLLWQLRHEQSLRVN